jgi:hypothetical protein
MCIITKIAGANIAIVVCREKSMLRTKGSHDGPADAEVRRGYHKPRV